MTRTNVSKVFSDILKMFETFLLLIFLIFETEFAEIKRFYGLQINKKYFCKN